jgi:hypothetical protein
MRAVDVFAIAVAVVIALLTLIVEPWSIPWWIGLTTASVMAIATALRMARGIWKTGQFMSGAEMAILGVALICAGSAIGLIGAMRMDHPKDAARIFSYEANPFIDTKLIQWSDGSESGLTESRYFLIIGNAMNVMRSRADVIAGE